MSSVPPSTPAPRPLVAVAAALRHYLPAGGGVVVAVSGGADSTALLLALTQLRTRASLALTAAHLDHGLRDDSAADAAWVAELCRRLETPLVVHRAPSGALSRDAGLEATARDWRRSVLADVARDCGARWVAMAHTANDQAETVLHRLLRGTGLAGLAGIAPVAPLAEGIEILRPLLDVSREELEAWLRACGETWRTDPTNEDRRHARNRIRHDLLPLLREGYNPQVEAALCRLARQCRELTVERCEALEVVLSSALLEATPDLVRLHRAPLARLAQPERREALRMVWRRQSWPEQAMTFRHWENLAELVASPADGDLATFPGAVQLTQRGGLLQLQRRSGSA